MFYKHKKFTLDEASRRVFDFSGRELRITGNAYLVLVFLCSHGPATVTEIGEFLDRNKDYNEDHLRQYRYKVNSIIGEDIIEYKNGIYSVKGRVEKIENLAENDRITDLLQYDAVEYDSKIKEMTEIKFSRWPALISIAVILLAFYNWPYYGFYTLMKFIVCGTAAYYAFYFYSQAKRGFWFWSMLGIAILFNPIIPIYLYSKSAWLVVDVLVVGVMVGVVMNKNYKKYNS